MTTRTCDRCGRTKNLETGFWRCNHQYEKPRYRLTCRQCLSDAKPKKPRAKPKKLNTERLTEIENEIRRW